MRDILTIIIPTYNNPQYLNPCVNSIIRNGILNGYGKLIIVNNGSQDCEKDFAGHPGIQVLSPGKNLGWELGLELGLKHTHSGFVCFQNDDTQVISLGSNFYERLLMPFQDRRVAAVGPMTTVSSGWQSVFMPNPLVFRTEVTYLIYFTVMIRMEALNAVGGIDTSLPGGDDIDLSIRFRKAGYRNIVTPDAFLIHHGFKTGERVRGGPDKAGGWNSESMQERTNHALIGKHGFRTFIDTIRGRITQEAYPADRLEETLILSMLNGTKSVAELGCGNKRLVRGSTTFDITPKGESVANHEVRKSEADIACDVTKPLPTDRKFDTMIAEHILEHCLDPVATINNWKKNLTEGGRLIIAVPDESITSGIPLDPEHCHAYSIESLNNLMSTLGFRTMEARSSGNGMSFVGCYEKC